MFGDVVIEQPARQVVVVPDSAVLQTGTRSVVFVIKSDGTFEPREVSVGTKTEQVYEVRSGLAAGERVVTQANFLIDSESRLRAAIEGQTATETAAGGASSSTCAKDFDGQKYPDKVQACRACEVQHRGMGTMEDDCKNAIPRPWR